jgi:hypothetical protein
VVLIPALWPVTTLTFTAMESPIRKTTKFWLGPTNDNFSLGTERFASFYRLLAQDSLNVSADRPESGASTSPINIDFDLGSRLWRQMGDNGTFTRSGSWTQTNTSTPHLLLPELGLRIPDYNNFGRACEYEPFMKVHREYGKLSRLARDYRDEWSPRNEASVVLRTASFGFGQGHLEVCAKRKDYYHEGVPYPGMGAADALVVTGIIAATRLRGQLDETRPLCVRG